MFYVFPLPLGDAATVVLVAVFLIVFVTTYQVLKKRRLFENPGAFVLAGCVALLSVLGLLPGPAASPPASPENRPATGHDVSVEFLLLPYAALAVTLVLMILLAWISRLFQQHRARRAVEPSRPRLEHAGVHRRVPEGEPPPTRRCPLRVRQIHQSLPFMKGRSDE